MAGTRDIGRKFTLLYEADTTDFIAAFASVQDVKTALESLSSIGTAHVAQTVVTIHLVTWVVTFESSVAGDRALFVFGTFKRLEVIMDRERFG